ncbi:MAG: cyclic nucleotide-binding domain-containing protein [Cytophagaceae bacterium]|nr:cyclic nucleotide-binding domain-containing protein [Gemmatimonadaceae bacterium]
MSGPTIIERLLAHRALGEVPRDQLEWLAAESHLRVLEPGDVLTVSGTPVAGTYVVFEGHLSIRVDRGMGSRIVMEWKGGDVTGLLPYSRLKTPPANVVAEQHTEILMLDREKLPRLIRECYDLTARMVHVMIDRTRVFKSSELLDEKMASLGRLAAGLAHELNNPASAVARSAKALVQELERLDEATRRYFQLNLADTQVYSIDALRDERSAAGVTLSPIEAADNEDALADWLDAHGVEGVDVEPLVATSLGPQDLDAIGGTVGVEKVGPVLAHMASGQVVRRLATEISTAASRIHALVAAVKGFTYMDQQAALQPIPIGRGLADTITVMGGKARSKSVQVVLEVPPDLPDVDGYGGELNQVWANLLDNAIDATPNGHVKVTASVERDNVVVRVIDDGPGVPADVVGRIFDPFFTTKRVGEGTGLGLDISRRVVHRHNGEIDLTTGSTGTEFRVILPIRTMQPDGA